MLRSTWPPLAAFRSRRLSRTISNNGLNSKVAVDESTATNSSVMLSGARRVKEMPERLDIQDYRPDSKNSDRARFVRPSHQRSRSLSVVRSRLNMRGHDRLTLLLRNQFLKARILAQRVPQRIDPKIAAGFAIGHFQQMRQSG